MGLIVEGGLLRRDLKGEFMIVPYGQSFAGKAFAEQNHLLSKMFVT